MGKGKRPELDIEGRKRCPQCKEYKALSEYSPAKGKTFNVNAWCKVCIAKKRKAGYTLEKARTYHLLSTYGLTIEDYEEMLEQQNYVCACCGLPETRRTGRSRRSENVPMLHVDHCHGTGVVRGLLCSSCNQALGLLGEDPKRIKALLKYVEEHMQKDLISNSAIEGEALIIVPKTA
jgi:hypothetical protein